MWGTFNHLGRFYFDDKTYNFWIATWFAKDRMIVHVYSFLASHQIYCCDRPIRQSARRSILNNAIGFRTDSLYCNCTLFFIIVSRIAHPNITTWIEKENLVQRKTRKLLFTVSRNSNQKLYLMVLISWSFTVLNWMKWRDTRCILLSKNTIMTFNVIFILGMLYII